MKALIVVDVQNEWFDKKSPEYLGEHKVELDNIQKMVNNCRKKEYVVIFIRHLADKEFKEGTTNSEIAIKTDMSDVIITKKKISPFYETNLDYHIADCDEVIICGILTNLCVRSCASDAYDRDFKVTIVEDCCISTDKKTHEFTLKDLKATRPEINIIKANKFL